MLSVTGLSKRFGGNQALFDVQLAAGPGEVLAVVGENGAGKSTLMKLLAGALQPDSGSITLSGSPFHPSSPAEAVRGGVAFVPQESEIVPHLSVADNILLGREPTRAGIIDGARLRDLAHQALAQVTTEGQPMLDLHQRADRLGPGDRQRVVIARALSQSELRILIFDEPTSSLGTAEAERLFSVIQRLKQRGLTILYVSHFLEEVLRVADRFIVLRDGRAVSHGKIADTTAAGLIDLMTGASDVSRWVRLARPRGELLLEAKHLAGIRLPREASLELYAGEVLGIAGLVGAGRTELVRAIFGLDAVRGGTVTVGRVHSPRTPAQCLRAGVGLLSEDRRNEGLAQSLGIAENITLSRLPGRGPFVSGQAQHALASALIQRLGIRCHSPRQPVSELSGGNQQKVALARLLHHDVDILLLDEPTRGIDVRSRAEVHRAIDALARRGKAILLISSYMPELLGLSDRIAVMCRGNLGRARPVAEWDEHSLLLQATGAVS